jgi:hypothetical protein
MLTPGHHTNVLFDVTLANEKDTHGEYAKYEAAERLSELTDELRRRAFSIVEQSGTNDVYVAYKRIDARVLVSDGGDDFGGHAASIQITPSANRERPFTISAAVNTPEGYAVLRPGREVTFEGVLLFVDDFLAGFKAACRTHPV